MARRKNKKSKRRLAIFGTLSLIVIGYFIFTACYYSYKIAVLEKSKKQLNEQLTELQTQEKNLTTDIQKLKDPEYIAKYARSKGYSVWSYTGYTWEELMALGKEDKAIMDFLKELDVLVDGRFILGKKSFSCLFRGSTNQRIIDVKKSLKSKKIVLVEKYYQDVKKKKEHIYI